MYDFFQRRDAEKSVFWVFRKNLLQACHMRWRNQLRSRESRLMRVTAAVFLLALSHQARASEALWKRLQTEPNLVVLMRHAKTAGGNPLTWDPSGQCKGERMLTE